MLGGTEICNAGLISFAVYPNAIVSGSHGNRKLFLLVARWFVRMENLASFLSFQSLC